jgi:heme-degrading monooxygenase HmoA
MVVVIFEVWTAEGQRGEYLDLAAELKTVLEKVDGFISVERYESLTEKGKLLSLSTWRDDAAVRAWRNVAEHRVAQARGRASIFAGYRLRVASVMRDYGMDQRAEAPSDSQAVHE